MNKIYRILTINPGSTSTKVALFDDMEEVFKVNLEHSAEELGKFKEIQDQKPYRMQKILNILKERNIDISTIDAFVGRGGAQEPMPGGTYVINELAYQHASTCRTAKHPAALGAPLARDLAQMEGKSAFMVNPPSVDEFMEESRISGIKEIKRKCNVHALNQKEVAIRYAKSHNRQYQDMKLVVAHIGGGISITAHSEGKMIDSNDCLGSSGAFAPTRCGSVPVLGLIKMCFSGNYTEKEMSEKVTKTGGLVDYLGTSDVREVRRMIADKNEYAAMILRAMVLQIKKDIGGMCAVLNNKVDAIILTGGVSYDNILVEEIRNSFENIPVIQMAGEFEMEAMASGAIRVLTGEETAMEYTGEPVERVEWFSDAVY